MSAKVIEMQSINRTESGAVREMEVDPPESSCRRRFQTAAALLW